MISSPQNPDRSAPNLVRGLGRILAGTILIAGFSSCADPAPAYYQAFGYECTDHHGHTADAMCNKSHDPGAAKVSRYCYKSLADTNCFDRPDPDQKNQPQGSPG